MSDDWDQVTEQISVSDRLAAEALIVDVDGFEGPLDLLLTLSRTQKVDLRRISVLQLAEQYLGFVEQGQGAAHRTCGGLSGDGGVARLSEIAPACCRPIPPKKAPAAEDLAAHLAFQLERLQAMREAAARLMARDQMGRDFFARGLPEDCDAAPQKISYSASLIDLMQAYARIRTKDEFRPFVMDRNNVFTMEQALERMRGLIGYAGEWTDLTSWLPDGWESNPQRRRSATAAHFAAMLELAKRGQLEIRQGETFAPIQVRRREGG